MKSTESLCKDNSNQSNHMQTQKSILNHTNQSILNHTNQIHKTSEQNKKYLNFFHLYKYADKTDYLLIFIGIILSAATGCGLPFFAVVAGNMVDAFQSINDQMITKTQTARNQFLYIGAATFVAALFSVLTWMKVGERVSLKCRKLYLSSILQKNTKDSLKFKDKNFQQEMENNFKIFRQALGYKVGSFIFIAASLIAGGRNAISTGWLLSLIMVSTLPLLGISGVLYTFFLQLKKTNMQKCYKQAEKRSQKILQNLKHIKMLNSEKHQIEVYGKLCTFLRKKVMMFSCLVGVSAGWFSLVQFGVYALAFWFGSHCVEGTSPCQIHDQNDRYTPGGVIVIFFAFYVRLDSMQQILPTLRKIYAGMQAGYQIYEIIQNSEGQDMKNIEEEDMKNNQMKQQSHKMIEQGYIEFEKVSIYDRQKGSEKILDQISFMIEEKQVCFSGDKNQLSKIRDLILGFINPDEGTIKINGIDISKINKKQYLASISYIGNENGLFDTTVINNLNHNLKIQHQQIDQLMKEFNIQNVIDPSHLLENLPIGYQGTQLQYIDRRKILLIRALLKKPKIILINQILTSAMEHQEYQIFSKFVSLSDKTSHIIYFGTNPHIISTIPIHYQVKNSKIYKQNLSDQLNPLKLQKQPKISSSFTNYQNVCQVLKSYKSSLKKSPQTIELNQQKKLLQLYSNQNLIRLIPLIKQFKAFFSIGLFFSFLCGILYPIFTIFLADILLQTFKFKNQIEEKSFIRENIQKPVLVIVYIGISSFVFNFMENIIFSILSQKIKRKIRTQSYQKLLNLPLRWYSQNPLHQPYNVIKGLSQNGSDIASLLTGYVPILFKNIISTISGLIIAFIFQWRSALLGFITLPMMMASGYLLMKFFNQNDTKTQKKYKESSTVILQAINNYRTVKIDNLFKLVEQLYQEKLHKCENSSFLRSIVVGLRFGLSQLLIFVSFALMFYFGSVFLKDNNGEMSVLSLFSGIFAVIWPGWTSGSNFFRVPDYEKCKKGLCCYFEIMDSREQSMIFQEQKKEILSIKDRIQLVDVKIECQDEILSINKLVLQIGSEQKVSYIVGSCQIVNRIIQVILGLSNNVVEGQILIDGRSIKEFDIKYLRNKIICIENQPFIFQGTIRENLLYNLTEEHNQQVQFLWNFINIIEQNFNNINLFQQTFQNTKFPINQQSNSSETMQNNQCYHLETILQPNEENLKQTKYNQNILKEIKQNENIIKQIKQNENIIKQIKYKVSLIRALVRKPFILFISDYNQSNLKFYQKILSTQYGKYIKKIFILKQKGEVLIPLSKQVLCIQQRNVAVQL